MKSGFVNCFDWSFTPSQNYVHHCGSSCKNLVERKYSKPSIRFLDIITYNYVYIYIMYKIQPHTYPLFSTRMYLKHFETTQGQPFFQPPCLVQRCSVWYFSVLERPGGAGHSGGKARERNSDWVCINVRWCRFLSICQFGHVLLKSNTKPQKIMQNYFSRSGYSKKRPSLGSTWMCIPVVMWFITEAITSSNLSIAAPGYPAVTGNAQRLLPISLSCREVLVTAGLAGLGTQ